MLPAARPPPYKHTSIRHRLRAVPGKGGRLVTPSAGPRKHHSPSPVLSTADGLVSQCSFLVRVPCSGQPCSGLVGGPGGNHHGGFCWARVHLWIQAPVSRAEGRYGIKPCGFSNGARTRGCVPNIPWPSTPSLDALSTNLRLGEGWHLSTQGDHGAHQV